MPSQRWLGSARSDDAMGTRRWRRVQFPRQSRQQHSPAWRWQQQATLGGGCLQSASLPAPRRRNSRCRELQAGAARQACLLRPAAQNSLAAVEPDSASAQHAPARTSITGAAAEQLRRVPNAEQQGECYPALAPDPCSALTGALRLQPKHALWPASTRVGPNGHALVAASRHKYVPQMRSLHTQLRCTLTGDIVPVTLQRPNDEAGEQKQRPPDSSTSALLPTASVSAACTSPCCHLQAMLESGASLCTAAQSSWPCEDSLVTPDSSHRYSETLGIPKQPQ